jgi:AcrR family transcriptional regulator
MTDAEPPVARERLIVAAFEEFAAHGFAGARVDRIAAHAGCNKNLIYLYYRNKETLFRTVLQKYLSQVYVELPFTADDLAAYAGRVTDFALRNPELMRLLAWSSLERQDIVTAARTAAHQKYAGEIAAGQRSAKVNGDYSASLLLTTIMAIATAWSPAFPIDALAHTDSPERRQAIGEHVRRTVALLCRP